MSANDSVMRDPLPSACCGKCQYWGKAVPSGRGFAALGLCYVRRGNLPLYTPPTRACDVLAAGVLLFKPMVVLA